MGEVIMEVTHWTVSAGLDLGKREDDLKKIAAFLKREHKLRSGADLLAAAYHRSWYSIRIPLRLKIQIKHKLDWNDNDQDPVQREIFGTKRDEPAEEGESELDDGWEVLWNSEYNCNYYYHATSGISQWEAPKAMKLIRNNGLSSPLGVAPTGGARATVAERVSGRDVGEGRGEGKSVSFARHELGGTHATVETRAPNVSSKTSTIRSVGGWGALRLGPWFVNVAKWDTTKQPAQLMRVGDEVRLRGLVECEGVDSSGTPVDVPPWSPLAELPPALAPPYPLFFTLDTVQLQSKKRGAARGQEERLPSCLQVCVDPGSQRSPPAVLLLRAMPSGCVMSLDSLRWACGGTGQHGDAGWSDIMLGPGFSAAPRHVQRAQLRIIGDTAYLRGRVVCSEPCVAGSDISEPLPPEACPPADVLLPVGGRGGEALTSELLVEGIGGQSGAACSRIVVLASSATLQLRDDLEAGQYFSLDGVQWSVSGAEAGWLPLLPSRPFFVPTLGLDDSSGSGGSLNNSSRRNSIDDWMQPPQYRLLPSNAPLNRSSSPVSATEGLRGVLQLRGVLRVGGDDGAGAWSTVFQHLPPDAWPPRAVYLCCDATAAPTARSLDAPVRHPPPSRRRSSSAASPPRAVLALRDGLAQLAVLPSMGRVALRHALPSGTSLSLDGLQWQVGTEVV